LAITTERHDTQAAHLQDDCPMIHYDHVTRAYGTKVAVDRLELFVDRGELVAFLGPNGAGKTTSVKMAVGLLRPTSGRVLLCDVDVAQDPRRAVATVGYVPDQPYLYDRLTGREFLEFVADLRGMPHEDCQRAIVHQAEVFGLSDFLDDLAESYSHGMKQRVVFAAAVLHDPAVLIVDEPMVGLDPKSMRLVKDLLRARADAGTTVFMSTHTLAVVEEIADRIGVLNGGQLLFLGTINELQQRLADRDATLEELYLRLTGENGNKGSAQIDLSDLVGAPHDS